MAGWMNRKGRPWGRKVSWREGTKAEGDLGDSTLKDQMEEEEGMLERWQESQERASQRAKGRG